MDTITFLSQADVDGDGQATLADRMALDLWVLDGGDLSSAIAGAILRSDGTYNLRPFFDDLALQNAAAAGPAEPLGAGGEVGGDGPPQGGSTCNYVEGQELPPYQEVIVSNSKPGNLQAEINAYLGGAYANDLRLRVSPGTYSRIDINMSMLRGNLIIYAEQGPGATRIDGNNGPAQCIQVFESVAGACALSGGSKSLTIGWTLQDDNNLAPPFATNPTCATPLPTDPSAFGRGWLGFDLCQGTDVVPGVGGGIVLDRTTCPVEVRGCYIHDQATLIPAIIPLSGAGVGLISCMAPVSLILNQISHNRALDFGAGVYVDNSVLAVIAKNWIFGNTFGNSTATLGGAPSGGGVFATDSVVELCRNQIYEHSARRGAGVYYGFEGGGSVYLEENDIYNNNCAWVSNPPILPPSNFGFQGAGVYVGLRPFSTGPFSAFGRSVGFLRNKIHDNSAIAIEPVGALATDHQSGGGIFTSVGLSTSSGPPGALAQNFFIGNSIYRNEALSFAGGMFLECVTDPVTFLIFENNTIDANRTTTTTPMAVPGLALGCSGYVQWRAANNVISNNLGLGTFTEWWACCSGTGPVTTPLQYTHAKDEFPVGCPASLDLFGAVVTNNPNTLTANIFYPLVPNDNPHLGAASTAVNTGQNPAPSWAAFAGFDSDIDSEPRIHAAVIDRGADERVDGDFKRGDANLDAAVNVADVVFILCWLFPPAPPAPPCTLLCLDAADTNDLGDINIADTVYLLGFLFGSPPGPPPPAPGPTTCGVDPTADTLDCVAAGVGCP